MDPLIWSGLLLVIGLLLVVAEVFVPSGGLLGFLSLTAVVSAVYLAFSSRGLEVGVTVLTITAVAVPLTLALAFRWWPKTPMGRRLLLGLPEGDQLPDSPLRQKLRSLVGQVGTASSLMMPSGSITVGGQAFDALSDGTFIEPGTRVRVVDVRGNRVLVRPAGDEPAASSPDDVLSQPIDSLGLDDFNEPLG